MSIELKWTIVGWGAAFIQIGLPLLLMHLPFGKGPVRFPFYRVLVVTTICWLCANAYRLVVELPVCAAYARERGNHSFDGVGANVAILFVGWVIPFVMAMGVWAISSLAAKIRSKK